MGCIDARVSLPKTLQLSADMARLKNNLNEIVKASVTTTKNIRLPVAIAANLSRAGTTLPVQIIDLSLTTAMIKPRDRRTTTNFPIGADLTLDLSATGPLPVRVLLQSDGAAHVRFMNLSEGDSRKLRNHLFETRSRDQTMADICRNGARQIEAAFTEAVRSNRITLADLFDDTYVEVPYTDPLQHITRFTDLTDALLPPIQDQILTADQHIVFSAAVDRNGYLPTHNAQYSQPQRPDQPDWNAAHCRNRRIFTDRTGLLAGHNREPAFTQTYEREVGAAEIVFLKEVDCPIMVEQRHWGNLRLAYSA